MHATIEDVHHGGGEHVGVHAAQVLVEGQAHGLGGSAGAGQRAAQDGVGAQGTLVVGRIGSDKRGIHGALVAGVQANEGVGALIVHMLNGGQNALAHVAVPKLDGLEGTGGSAGRNDGAAGGAVDQRDLNLDGGVAARIEDLATIDINNFTHL